MTKVFIVIKNDLVEHVCLDKKSAINKAEEMSGLKLNIPIASVSVWESIINGNNKVIWSLDWVPSSLEPNIFEVK